MGDGPGTGKAGAQVLESGVSVSRSLIWRLQREYYAERGLRAWTDDAVPHYITNNPFLAELYARLVLGFMKDCETESVRILELGAGPGKFAFLFLRHFRALLHEKGLDPAAVRYCMTESAEGSLAAWRANEDLKPLVDSGVLQFERWQAGEERALGFLAKSGPLVVIANYVFDSLAQDAFTVHDGEVFEALVTTTSPAADATPSQFQFSFQEAKVDVGRYPDPGLEHILAEYGTLPAANFTFPVQALQTLAALRERCSGELMVLVADKGFAQLQELSYTQGPPSFEFHGPVCFSQMVNLDAIGRFFRASGGHALLPQKYGTFRLCAFLHARDGERFAQTQAAYREAQLGFGLDDVFTVLGWLHPHMEEMTVSQILAVLRMTRWDPVVLMPLFPVLAQQLPKAGAERGDLRDAVLRTWENHFPVGNGDNVFPFQCGAILLALGFYDDARPFFERSLALLGPSAATNFNLGLCASGSDRGDEAIRFMNEALRLDPGFAPAQEALRKLQTKPARD